MAEQQVLQQIAEALRPSVLRGMATEQWPPAFVNIVVPHIIAQWNEVQSELQPVRAECARLKQTEADLRADPISIWLREAQAAEQAAQRRADKTEVDYRSFHGVHSIGCGVILIGLKLGLVESCPATPSHAI